MTLVPPSMQTNGTLYHLPDKNHKSQQPLLNKPQEWGIILEELSLATLVSNKSWNICHVGSYFSYLGRHSFLTPADRFFICPPTLSFHLFEWYGPWCKTPAPLPVICLVKWQAGRLCRLRVEHNDTLCVSNVNITAPWLQELRGGQACY